MKYKLFELYESVCDLMDQSTVQWKYKLTKSNYFTLVKSYFQKTMEIGNSIISEVNTLLGLKYEYLIDIFSSLVGLIKMSALPYGTKSNIYVCSSLTVIAFEQLKFNTFNTLI